jgi:shikimate dehydrogenase
MSDRFGLNTDAGGFLDVLAGLGVASGARVLLLGAGGSARALVASLHEAGFDLRLWNRTRSRMEELVSELGLSLPILGEPDAGDVEVVVNTTSASLSGDSVAVRWGVGQVAIDLAYGDGPTPFLQEALQHGARVEDGRSLLVAQGARSLEFWLGLPAPRDVMARAIGAAGH